MNKRNGKNKIKLKEKREYFVKKRIKFGEKLEKDREDL